MNPASPALLRNAFALGAILLVGCSGTEGPGPGTGTSGGSTGLGGSPGTGGSTTTGGSFSSGGAASGGAANGGSGTGGSFSSGGTSSGGSANGGTSNPMGGSANGGSSKGGSTSGGGGNVTGGSANGGKGGSAQGGSSTGGSSMGGKGGATGTGGSTGGAATGGSSMGGSGAGGSTGTYACNGSTAGYNATMIKSGSTWTVTNGGKSVYSGSDMEAALRAAYGSLTSGRTTKQSILVQGSGDIPAASQVSIPSYTVLNVCGTINVSGTSSGDKSPLYARNARDIEIPNLKMTGSPVYGIFFRGTNNMYLGQIDLRLSSSAGIGIRVDTSGSAGTDTNFNTNLKIDYVYGSGMGSHIVETYGISQITIGKVEGSNVGECGLLFNRSINATVDLVTCTNCASGTGYAAFRMANNNGVISGGTGTVNIVAKSVVARGGGRGIFSVSGSGAARIDHVDIQDTGNNSILLENAHNVTVGSTGQQSRIASAGDLRIAGTSSDIRIQNIALSGTSAVENPCATNSTWTSVNGAPTNCN